MSSKLKAEYHFTFIRGGISNKSQRPYLSVSNGRAELFVQIPKSITNDDFLDMISNYQDGDTISLQVALTPGSEAVELIAVL